MKKKSLNKAVDMQEMMELFQDGQTIMFGGFGGVGTPPGLSELLYRSGCRNLLLIGNDAGFPWIGIGPVVSNKQAAKMIVSHIGSNPDAGRLMNEGEMEVEFSPQGTLMERIRAGGMGLGGILTDVGLDEEITSRGKQRIQLGEQIYLAEPALTADISIVYAEKADAAGNLVYNKSARNTNPLAAMAGRITIAEVNEIVPLGALDPESIITPGVYVDYIVQSKGVNWKWVWQHP